MHNPHSPQPNDSTRINFLRNECRRVMLTRTHVGPPYAQPVASDPNFLVHPCSRDFFNRLLLCFLRSTRIVSTHYHSNCDNMLLYMLYICYIYVIYMINVNDIYIYIYICKSLMELFHTRDPLCVFLSNIHRRYAPMALAV